MKYELKTYIEENRVCSELIFRDWQEFLDVLFTCGGSVEEILWFEYVAIGRQTDSLGGGGYIDPSNPDYMWAETMIYHKQLGQKSPSELYDFIQNTIAKNLPHQLVPCFFTITE